MDCYLAAYETSQASEGYFILDDFLWMFNNLDRI